MLLDFVPTRNFFAAQGTRRRSRNNSISISSSAFSFHHTRGKTKMKEDCCSERPRQAGGRQQQLKCNKVLPIGRKSPCQLYRERTGRPLYCITWLMVGVHAAPHKLNVQHSTSHSSSHPSIHISSLWTHRQNLTTLGQTCSSWLPTSGGKHQAASAHSTFIGLSPLYCCFHFHGYFLFCHVRWKDCLAVPAPTYRKPVPVQLVAPLQTFLSRVAWNVLISLSEIMNSDVLNNSKCQVLFPPFFKMERLEFFLQKQSFLTHS